MGKWVLWISLSFSSIWTATRMRHNMSFSSWNNFQYWNTSIITFQWVFALFWKWPSTLNKLSHHVLRNKFYSFFFLLFWRNSICLFNSWLIVTALKELWRFNIQLYYSSSLQTTKFSHFHTHRFVTSWYSLTLRF